MILIISGKFQHELDFISEKFGIYADENHEYNNTAKIIYTMNDIVEKWFDNGLMIEKEIKKFYADNKKNIIVVIQRGCGIVPVDERLRALREYEGRTFSVLADYADEVYSVMCGIGIKIKG